MNHKARRRIALERLAGIKGENHNHTAKDPQTMYDYHSQKIRELKAESEKIPVHYRDSVKNRESEFRFIGIVESL